MYFAADRAKGEARPLSTDQSHRRYRKAHLNGGIVTRWHRPMSRARYAASDAREPIKTIERQWYALSELSMTKVLRTRTSGFWASQAVTASPSDSRSLALVAVKTFTTLTLSALTDASPVPDAAASSILLCTINKGHRSAPLSA
jgi:hypothetical protein